MTPRSPLPPTSPAAPGSRLRTASRKGAALAAMLTALAVLPAGAAAASTAQPSTGQSGQAQSGTAQTTSALASSDSVETGAGTQSSGIRHFNTGATHSPQLLRMLARPSTSTSGATAPGGSASPVMRAGLVPATLPVLPGALQGIDVASYQEDPGISWTKVAAAGIKFAAIKVTEGDYYTNPDYQADLKGAQAAHLPVIAYAFAIPDGFYASASPVVQADDVLAKASGSGGQVPEIMLDIEYDPYGYTGTGGDGTNSCYGLSTAQMQTWITGFANEIKAKTGQLPIIYTTQDWWQKCTDSSTALSQDELWVADYTTATSPAPLPAAWTNWNLWQYTSSGSVNGITGNVDLDQLNPAVPTLVTPGIHRDAVENPDSVQLLASMSGLTYTATGLPAGLTLDSASGQISGTPTTTGSYPVSVTATDPVSSATTSVSFTWDVHGTITVTQPADRSAAEGSPADFLVKSTDSVVGQAVTYTATGLPPGITITSAGATTARVAGFPTKAGTYTVHVTGSDSLGATGSASFTWTVSQAANRGPAGAVYSGQPNRCLDDVGNQAASGTEADGWPCNGSAAQYWRYVQDGTLRIHGMCLNVPGKTAASGARVRLEPCTGVPRQQWLPAYPRAISPSAGASPTTLLNPWSGMCLTDPSATKGTRIIIRPCAGTASQAWTLPAAPLRSLVPGKCMDDAGNSSASGTKIDIQTCSGTAAQRWKLKQNGTVRVHGRCLGLRNHGTAAGTKAALYYCDGTASQVWHLTPSSSGLLLKNPRSGRCLEDPAASTVNGTQLILGACRSTPARLWRPA